MADDVLLIPCVTVITHPIETEAHPGTPPGYRWAVQVGGQPASDLRFCANAGHAQTKDEALFIGDRCAATAVVALRIFGVQVMLKYLDIDHDPVPSGGAFLRPI